MTQQVAESNEALRVSKPAVTLQKSCRVDGPHWLIAQLLDFGTEPDAGYEDAKMSWRSKLVWYCDPRKWLRTIVHLQDTPHSIALGTAIGVFIGMTPTFGIQMLLVVTLAFLFRPFFRFNQIAALLAVYISNPFTMVPIYWFNYRLGTLFTHSNVTWDEFVDLFHYSKFSEWFVTISNVFYTLGAPLIIGSFLVATVLALPTYPLMLRLVERVQRRRVLRKQKHSSDHSCEIPLVEVAQPESSSVTCHDHNEF